MVKSFGDNDQATMFAQEDMVTSGNKYYYLPYYWIKEVEGIFVKTDRVATENNNADVMTKAVDKNTLQYLKPRVTGYTGHDGTLFKFDPAKAIYIPP